jgi:hypothetical protein
MHAWLSEGRVPGSTPGRGTSPYVRRISRYNPMDVTNSDTGEEDLVGVEEVGGVEEVLDAAVEFEADRA